MADTDRAQATRRKWLATLDKYRRDFEQAGSAEYWSPSLDCASRDELRAIQDEKLAALTPFLYENSLFYRRRFDKLGLAPGDIRSVDDLVKWPPVDKKEMSEDLMANPPWGTYTTHGDDVWKERGWTLFPTSGTTGLPRVFRYSKLDLKQWQWANARALWSLGARTGELVFLVGGFGPHVWAWGVVHALAHMGVPCIPGGGLTAEARCNIILRYRPTVLATLPSQLLRLGRIMQQMGHDPGKTSIKTLFTGGEPAAGIASTRERLEDMWGAKLVEFYGCTEAAPHSGGYSCHAAVRPDGTIQTHLMEDLQVWELIDPQTGARVPEGGRGITVCTNMNSESSSQLRFVVGDYTVFDTGRCACGRTHVRALGGFHGRADELAQSARDQVLPVRTGGRGALGPRRWRRVRGRARHQPGRHRFHDRPGRASRLPSARGGGPRRAERGQLAHRAARQRRGDAARHPAQDRVQNQARQRPAHKKLRRRSRKAIPQPVAIASPPKSRSCPPISANGRPPFRADHIGSLLRPPALREAFKQFAAKTISEAQFRKVQDDAIRDVVKLQGEVGLGLATDGEFRRPSYWARFVALTDGFVIKEAQFKFHDDHGHETEFTAPHVVGSLKRRQPISMEEFSFVKPLTRAVPKITMPSPSTMHYWRVGNWQEPGVYRDATEMFVDLGKVYQQEIAELAAAGCQYVQLDEVASRPRIFAIPRRGKRPGHSGRTPRRSSIFTSRRSIRR